MSVVGIVALSLIAGLFIALLIGISAWLAWQGHQFQRVVVETRSTLAEHRQLWTTTLTELRTMLDHHHAQTAQQIGNINGEKLQAAVERLEGLVKYSYQVAQRNERAAIAIGRFVQHIIAMPDADSVTEGVDGDGYAASEPGERFVSRSRTAADDAAAIADESADVTIAGSPFDNPDRTP